MNNLEKKAEKGYLFIYNSNKPSKEEYESITPIKLDSFAFSSVYAARKLNYRIYMGCSRKNANQIKCATIGFDIKYYNQYIYRNIFAFRDNYIAYKNACNVIKVNKDIDVIHCNTPIGGVIGRIVGYKYKKKVIYTAHGFHFYKGAPLLNWLLFYPIELLLAHFTDVLITINKEDYEIARKFKLKKNGKAYYVPGVGVDVEKFSNKNNDIRSQKRAELSIPLDAIVVIAVGRLDLNKNNSILIEAISRIKNDNLHLIICGEGEQRTKLEKIINIEKLDKRVHLLGNRNDVADLYKASDIFALSSLREGLSRSIMEAMASGLPCVVSKIRGNSDLIENEIGGYLYDAKDAVGFSEGVKKLSDDPCLRKIMGDVNMKKIQNFSVKASISAFERIFEETI